MEIVGHMPFKKVKRSYHSAMNGWRLATFTEAIDGLKMIKDKNILNKWDRVRLLDGWITGAGYNFDMGNDFKGCLGYMLLIQTETCGFPYADVDLSESGKEVALFLCVDDWNFEVVYWLLNCWSKSETMKLADVRGGNIPLINAAKFKEINESIGHVARKVGDEAGVAREKAGKIKYSGKDSVEHVLSGMIKCVKEKEIAQCIGQRIWHFTYYEAEEYCLPDSIKQEEVAEAFWKFVCDSFAGYVVKVCAFENLLHICNMKKKRTSGTNFMVATCILLYLSDYRTDIIHEPLAHDCTGSCAAKILSHAAKDGDPKVFNEMLRKNGMWRCYEETGNYSVLHKLLIVLAKAKKYSEIDKREEVCGEVFKMLLECGAQPERRYAIGKSRSKTTLYLVAKFRDEDVGVQVAEALLSRCDEQSIGDFVNAADDRGRTALHRASEKGNARICELLLNWGASLNAQDVNRMTALHYAVEGGKDKVTGLLLQSPLVTESLALKDNRHRTALDISVTNKDYQSTAKLLSKTEKPEAYLSNSVDKQQLLRYSILAGLVEIVSLLLGEGVKLPAGDCDDDKRTALHLAAMCDDEDSAAEMIYLKLSQYETREKNEKVLFKRDIRGRTALHEAALKGHKTLCELLLQFNSELIYVKDRNGQNPLFDAVRGDSNSTVLLKHLQAAYLKKDRLEDDLVNRSSLTPLHVAASEGKVQHVKELLSSDVIRNKYMSRGDMVGQTALHKAVTRGDIDIVEILLRRGSHPLRERDCDGRTALHYAVQADIEEKVRLVETLLMRCTEEEKPLLLWASAAGLGTADQTLRSDDPLQKFLVHKKEIYKKCNLLRRAALFGDIEMAKELLSRGYPIEDIRDKEWMNALDKANKEIIEKVSRQIQMIKVQRNDKPAIKDSLGRSDYAQALTAFFLNPYIKPPIAVGITGSWGMGKSSLMLQTERTLLAIAAQMALLQSSKLSSSTLEFSDIQTLSKTGKRKCQHIYKYIKYEDRVNRNIFVILWDNLKSLVFKPSTDKIHEKLESFLNDDDGEHLEVFKALAAMDSSDMLNENAWMSKIKDPSADENLPGVLTVQYNAWKYKSDTEALAGLAIEITRELEGVMTPARWWNTCWRYNWEKKKLPILIEIFIPLLLALVLASSITWIAWVVLGSEKFKAWGKAKYAWPPAAAVTIVWSLTRKVMGILKPISSQLMQYMSAPDHTDKLGYQERVISDINFLKAEIGKTPHWVFSIFTWICASFPGIGIAMKSLNIIPASGSNLRVIVFVDDLDRCDESVILQVLSAVNLVLAVCEINVVLGMDKKIIEMAISRKYGDMDALASLKTKQELAEMYLQKLIQLPLDLPDPSDENSMRFLRGQLGISQKNEYKESLKDGRMSSSDEEDRISSNDAAEVEINVEPELEITEIERREPAQIGRQVHSRTDGDASITRIQQNHSSLILRREILFVRYSEGEEKTLLYFQNFATGCRKLPREWKRLLHYHRFVWCIFSITKEANNIFGWQIQLMTWIFVCCEWQENMNFLIRNWKEIVNTSESNGLSLLMIVEHLIEEHQREITSAEDGDKRTEKYSEPGEESAAKLNNDEEIKSSRTEAEELNGNCNSRKKATSNKLVKKKNAASKKLDELEKSLAELKEEMNELKELVTSQMKKDMKELQNHLSDQIKKDIKELQKQVSKEIKNEIGEIKQNGKDEENMESKKIKLHNLENWKRMRSALERYDVPMDAIQAFQRFRFYCIAGYLPLPS